MSEASYSDYLSAAGAVAVGYVIMGDGSCRFRSRLDVSGITDPRWISQIVAPRVINTAKEIAGPAPSPSQASRALTLAAAQHGARFTPHYFAVQRATVLSHRLSESLRAMAAGPALASFHGEYRKRRLAAVKAHAPFMSFAKAKTRFRRAIIRRLINHGDLSSPGFMTEIFDGT